MTGETRMKTLRTWFGFPSAPARDWLVAAGYLLFFAAVFLVGGEWQ